MNLPGFNFHALRGFVPTRYTVHVNGPWCITFEFDAGDVCVSISSNTIEGQYHGRICSQARSEPVPDLPRRIAARGCDPATGKARSEIAALLGISRQHLYDILNERKPVSATVAVRLGKLFGDGAGVWARMQSAYDTWNAERELSDEIKRIPTIKTKVA